MRTTEWIALAIGVLLLATRFPALVWPSPYRERVLAILGRSGPGPIRALGAFLWVLVVTVVVLVLRTLTLLQGVLLVLAILLAATGAVALTHPEGYRRFSESLLARTPDWALRLGAAVGVALGAWLVYLSLTGA
ncbi:MAG: hypothetical protein AB1689_03100 [Thermodesulfobacteriota bacterium]